MYNKNYPKLPNPTVILTAVNVSNTHINSVFSLHDIAVWIEVSLYSYFTVRKYFWELLNLPWHFYSEFCAGINFCDSEKKLKKKQ